MNGVLAEIVPCGIEKPVGIMLWIVWLLVCTVFEQIPLAQVRSTS